MKSHPKALHNNKYTYNKKAIKNTIKAKLNINVQSNLIAKSVLPKNTLMASKLSSNFIFIGMLKCTKPIKSQP